MTIDKSHVFKTGDKVTWDQTVFKGTEYTLTNYDYYTRQWGIAGFGSRYTEHDLRSMTSLVTNNTKETKEMAKSTWQTTAETLQAEKDALQTKYDALVRGVVETVVSEGRENDYCTDGMTSFISEALSVGYEAAGELLKKFGSESVTVTVDARLPIGTDRYVASYNYDSVAEGVANALGIDTDDVDVTDVTITD